MKKLFNYLKNSWRFRKELSDFKDWDYSYNLKIFRRSLELTRDYIRDKGHEQEPSKMVKVYNMDIVIDLLKDFDDDNFTKQAEEQLGYSFEYPFHFEKISDEHYKLVSDTDERQEDRNHRINKLSNEIEKESWEVLWKLISNDIRGWWT